MILPVPPSKLRKRFWRKDFRVSKHCPIKTKGEAQEDKLEILKILVAQASPDSVVSDFKLPDERDPQNKRLTFEPAPHNGAKRPCIVSRNAPLAGMPHAYWVFYVGTEGKHATRVHIPCVHKTS